MTDWEIRKAELDVQRSTQDLDRALTHLEDRMDLTAKRTQRKIERAEDAIATIRKPVDKAQEVVGSARAWLFASLNKVLAGSARFLHGVRVGGARFATRADETSRVAVRGLQQRSMAMTAKVKENPRPYVLGAVALLACVGTALYLRRRRASNAVLMNGAITSPRPYGRNVAFNQARPY